MLDDLLPADPMPLFANWLEEAWANADTPNPNGMALSSALVENGVAFPSTRIVLLKNLVVDPGYVVFYTNYQSRKGHELLTNCRAGALLHWDKLGRQVRLEGAVVKSPAAESDAYFGSRHRASRIGAWTSAQSQPIESREQLLEKRTQTEQRFGEDKVPRPPHWGGFRLFIDRLELWCDGEFRLHDRAVWQRVLNHTTEPTGGDAWRATRLQP
ncbi:MAG: pyridoxamine 5'-phosphate oxidase [Pseudomonadota bacterium]